MENVQTKKTVLVTGGTGFLGGHTVLQLLQQGYDVKTTLRSLAKKDTILKALEEGGITDFSNLSFIEADLTSGNNWDEAVKGCDYVLHVASPFPAQDPKDENELIIPARDGALRVLKASRDAGVKRVVLTSSFAAVGYSKNIADHIFTEEDWTDINAELPAYIKSKTVAEKSAWEFIEKEGNGLELSVINPVGIFGPVIGGITSASLDIAVSGILNGTMNQTPPFTMGVVDVRDVADIHIKAMLHPDAAGERFIATSDDVMSFYDVAELFKKERPQYSSNIQNLEPIGKEFYKQMSNKKAKTILSWTPRSREEALLASADSLMINP
ncbi:Nucleoside-diphosphate-sugar epimerase [Chryseobacterium soldanellicola]|uniref:Nucleoside-diphosphate-sugar epimerase n=1 Tax=Chryseobacterium soldanellicola TaxID=311333 RepID=A0A1H1D4Z7_9FLAO|nr:aldehyde reductase [Chryseobacterium soldanellicola]SDQ71635.1 Nucleoside-diphosphate-sugar epimerase [Chryseobacterium soldanellicola]